MPKINSLLPTVSSIISSSSFLIFQAEQCIGELTWYYEKLERARDKLEALQRIHMSPMTAGHFGHFGAADMSMMRYGLSPMGSPMSRYSPDAHSQV